MSASDQIVISGAREHNLKDITLAIPRDALVVITGWTRDGRGSVASGRTRRKHGRSMSWRRGARRGPGGRTRSRLVAVTLALAAAFPFAYPPAEAAGVTRGRPNIIVFETDDQTAESMKVMSNTRRLLGDQGTTFDNSFVSLPLCCPSRATFLTGQYAHNHRVLSNSLPTGGYAKLDNRSTLAVWLSKAGYHTAFAGKYLNGYASTAEEGGPLAAPPGWRDWYADAAEGQYSYFDYQVNHNRRLIEFGSSPGDYRTDVLSRRLNSVIRVHAGSSKPLFLWAAFLSPHRGKAGEGKDMGAGPVPAPRHAGRFASVTLPMPASFNEADVSDKPASVRDEPPLEREDIERLRQTYAQQLESLLAVDDAVRSAVTALRQTGRLANTLIIFTSDNGYLNGAHRKLLKGLPYEPSIRVPLILRGPSVPAGQHRSQLVANVDLAPTILDAARVRPGRVVDGISVLPLARDPRLGEDRVLLLEGAPQSESDVFEFVGVRTARYKYIEWRTGEKELYDLKRDPDELASRAGDRAVASVQSMLAGRLRALRQCRGPSCRAVRAP